MKNEGGLLAEQLVKLCTFGQPSDFSDMLFWKCYWSFACFVKLDIGGVFLFIFEAY